MAKNSTLIILELRRIFEEETDEDRKKSIKKIKEELCKVIDNKYVKTYPNGFDIDKKTLKSYIDNLDDMGFEINSESIERGEKLYYHMDKLFVEQELVMLMNALNSFKFLSEKHTDRIKDKIKKISRQKTFDKLQEVIKQDPKLKVNDDKVILMIGGIADALLEHRGIEFKYCAYKICGKKLVLQPKKDEFNRDKIYRTKPYGVALNSGKMYMVARDLDNDIVKNFRVELIRDIKDGGLTEDNNDKFNLNDYLEKSISMFGGDELIELKLKVDERYIQNIKDYFGQNLGIIECVKDAIITKHSTYNTQGLISTLMRFGDRIEVLEPKSVRNKIREKAQRILNLYEE